MSTVASPHAGLTRAAPSLLPLAAVPFLLLPYDSLTHLLSVGEETGAQTFPATAAFSLVYLLLRGRTLRFTPASMAVLKRLSLLLLVLLALTGWHMAWESSLSTHLEEELRLPTALRQAVSFILGLTSFAMLQDALLRLGHRAAFRWTVLACLPSLMLVPFQAFTGVYRVQGFSSEPAQMADILVFAFLPACINAGLAAGRRRLLLTLGTVALLSTFSSTGFMKLGLVLLCYYVSTGRALRGLAVLSASLAALIGLLSLWPENYVFSTFYGLYEAWDASSDAISITFVDRYMGLVGPVQMLAQPRAWLGFGFGADSVYFYQLFDRDVADAIREVKWALPSITSLQGKALLYAGPLGYALYLSAWWAAWRGVPRGHAARYLIPAVYLASLFSLAPFFLSHVWLWLAMGATAATAGGVVVQARSTRPVAAPAQPAAPAAPEASR